MRLIHPMLQNPKISLLHATYFREAGPLKVKEAWLEQANRPDRVEYIFAVDSDDTAAVLETEGHLRVVSAPGNDRVTAVRNWNAAALLSSGDLLMVVADDLFAPKDWDVTLLGAIGTLNPRRSSFALKVTDSPVDGDMLLRHPVVSRAFYERFGLFSERYSSVYCDDDLTMRAFWRSVILDGRSLVLSHQHPTLVPSLDYSTSQLLVNSDRENQHGYSAYTQMWSRRSRSAHIVSAPPSPNLLLTPPGLFVLRWRNWARASVRYFVARVRDLLKLMRSPREAIHRLKNSRFARTSKSS